MLQFLSGRQHLVSTGMALHLKASGLQQEDVVVTRVQFRSLSQGEIGEYLGTGEPLGKAGGYGIQGSGALLVSRIEGCSTTWWVCPGQAGEMLKSFGSRLLCSGQNII